VGVDVRVPSESEIRITTDDPIRVKRIHHFLVRHHEPDIRVFKDVSAEPGHAEVDGRKIAGSPLLHVEETDFELACPSGKTRSAQNRNGHRNGGVVRGDSDIAAEKEDHVIADDILPSPAAAPATSTSASSAPTTTAAIIGNTELKDAGVFKKEV